MLSIKICPDATKMPSRCYQNDAPMGLKTGTIKRLKNLANKPGIRPEILWISMYKFIPK